MSATPKAWILLTAAWVCAGCGGEPTASPADTSAPASDAATDAADASDADEPHDTTAPAAWAATVDSSVKVSLFYSQGIARIEGGWVFSAAKGLWRTDDAYTELVEHTSPLPAELDEAGYRHIGDIDVAGGKIYAALEQKDFDRNEQAVARFDAMTLVYIDHVLLPQHKAPFIAVDEAPVDRAVVQRWRIRRDRLEILYQVVGIHGVAPASGLTGSWQPSPPGPSSRTGRGRPSPSTAM